MGLLSSVLTIGGAAAGFAVGGPAGAQLGASIGGAAGGALSSSSGSKKATKAQLKALEEARKIQGQSYSDVKGFQQPYQDFGGSSLNALTSRLGLPQSAPQAASSTNALTGAPSGGSPGASPMPSPFGGGSPLGGTTGVSSGFEPGYVPGGDTFKDPRTGLAPGQGAPTGPVMPTDSPQGPATGGPATSGMAPQPPQNALTGAPTTPGVDPGTYGNTANPTYTAPTAPAAYQAPDKFSFSADQYKPTPGYQYRQDQARQQVLSSAGATGALQSGAALKELYDRGDQIAYQDFTGERAYEAGRYDTDRNFGYGQSRDQRSDYENDRNFGRNIYSDDRDYLTGRFDTQTNNLFRGVGVGQGAANVVSNAATRYGDQVAGLVTAGGDARAQNALTQGQIGSDFSSGLGGLIGGFMGGGSGMVPSGGQNYTSDLGTVNYGNSLRMTSPYRY